MRKTIVRGSISLSGQSLKLSVLAGVLREVTTRRACFNVGARAGVELPNAIVVAEKAPTAPDNIPIIPCIHREALVKEYDCLLH